MRKRTETITRSFSYDIRLINPAPIIFQKARAMERLWDELCVALREFRNALPRDADKEIKSAAWNAFIWGIPGPENPETGKRKRSVKDTTAYRLAADRGDELDLTVGQYKWQVYNDWKKAVQTAVKGSGGYPQTTSLKTELWNRFADWAAQARARYGEEPVPEADLSAWWETQVEIFGLRRRQANKQLRSFTTCLALAQSGHRPWPEHREHRYRLERINLRYQTPTGAATPSVSKLWSSSLATEMTGLEEPCKREALPEWWTDSNGSLQLQICPVDPDIYFAPTSERNRRQGTRGYFTVGQERIPFLLPLSRPLPEGWLKYASLCGRRDGPDWDWSLVFTVEYEPTTSASVAIGRTYAFDAGWRQMGEYMRIGMLFDGRNYTELRLPYDLSTAAERRHYAYLRSKGLPCENIYDLRVHDEMRKRMDHSLEAVKARLRAAVEQGDIEQWPPAVTDQLRYLASMRCSGLFRICAGLAQAGLAIPWLDEWAAAYTKQQDRLRHGVNAWLARRDELYRLLGRHIADNCDALAWEGDLDLSEMAESEDQPPAIRASQRYRVHASLYKLRQIIRCALEKQARVVVDKPAAYTSRRCMRPTKGGFCGAEIPPGAALELVCAVGHKEDTDMTAAAALWYSLDEDLRAVPGDDASVTLSQLAGCLVLLSA